MKGSFLTAAKAAAAVASSFFFALLLLLLALALLLRFPPRARSTNPSDLRTGAPFPETEEEEGAPPPFAFGRARFVPASPALCEDSSGRPRFPPAMVVTLRCFFS